MKLINFRAEAVHKSYNFNIDFNQDLNFIVGINGSGKTTALHLIQAALSFNLRELYLIAFNKLSITLEQDKQIHELTIRKNSTEISIGLNNLQKDITLPVFPKEEIDQYLKSGRLDDYAEELKFKAFRESIELNNFFKKIQRPVFLGLERRFNKEEDYGFDDVRASRMQSIRSHMPSNRNIDQQVDGLENSKQLIKTAYKKFRLFSDRQSEKLIHVIVRSTFQYIDLVDLQITDLKSVKLNQYKEYQSILERRKEIEAVAVALGDSAQTSDQIEVFFDRLEKDFKEMNNAANAEVGFNLEWLLNKAQIQRILDILKEIDAHKRRANNLYLPIKSFIDTANFFFEQSGKIISVDSVGGLIIKLKDEDIPLISLSSGERQLLILLAHVVFMPRTESDVIIIDEPELSLHLIWQENLVQKLVDLNSSKQFIFATHSPEIIGYRKDKAVRVSK